MIVAGVGLAVSWLTILPARVSHVDRAVARVAIVVAPLVGLLLGVAAAGVAVGAIGLHAPPLLAGILAVALIVLGTRGMHVDGLADTVDALGCYGPPERALEVMKDSATGPFAVVALLLMLGAQAVSIGALASSANWPLIVIAVMAGRSAFVSACRRGLPSARPDGLGSLVAGSQPWWAAALWWILLTACCALLSPWTALAPLVAWGVVEVLLRHVRRRIGGVTGDVLGCCCELAVTVTLAVCVLS